MRKLALTGKSSWRTRLALILFNCSFIPLNQNSSVFAEKQLYQFNFFFFFEWLSSFLNCYMEEQVLVPENIVHSVFAQGKYLFLVSTKSVYSHVPQTQEIVRLNGIYKRLLSNSGVKMFEGEGKVVGPHEVELTQIDGTKLNFSAKHILVATGGRAQRPDIPGKVCYEIHIFSVIYFFSSIFPFFFSLLFDFVLIL